MRVAVLVDESNFEWNTETAMVAAVSVDQMNVEVITAAAASVDD